MRFTSAAVAAAAICALSPVAVSPVFAADILGPDAAACHQTSGKDAVLIMIDGLKSRDGTVRVELWPGTQEDFMRDHHELVAEGKAYTRVTVPVPASGPTKVCVPLPGPGTYAVGAFHSPSGQRKFNFRQDGATFTRNPKVGLSKPKAADVAMRFNSGLSEATVTMNYLRGLAFKPIPRDELQSAESR